MCYPRTQHNGPDQGSNQKCNALIIRQQIEMNYRLQEFQVKCHNTVEDETYEHARDNIMRTEACVDKEDSLTGWFSTIRRS